MKHGQQAHLCLALGHPVPFGAFEILYFLKLHRNDLRDLVLAKGGPEKPVCRCHHDVTVRYDDKLGGSGRVFDKLGYPLDVVIVKMRIYLIKNIEGGGLVELYGKDKRKRGKRRFSAGHAFRPV